MIMTQCNPITCNDKNMFHENDNNIAIKIISGKIKVREIGLELNAQLNYCTESGLDITHIDSHYHIHILPKIYKILVD